MFCRPLELDQSVCSSLKVIWIMVVCLFVGAEEETYVLDIYIGCARCLNWSNLVRAHSKSAPGKPLSLTLLSQVNIGIHFPNILESFDLSWVMAAVYMILESGVYSVLPPNLGGAVVLPPENTANHISYSWDMDFPPSAPLGILHNYLHPRNRAHTQPEPHPTIESELDESVQWFLS